MNSTTQTMASDSICPYCGKPYLYIGDLLPGIRIEQLVCQCPKPWDKSVEQSLTDNAAVWQQLADIDDGNYPKGAKCLGCGYVIGEGETHCCHANGLQISVTRFRVKCAKCGRETENFVIAPYGSKFDGSEICVECVDR